MKRLALTAVAVLLLATSVWSQTKTKHRHHKPNDRLFVTASPQTQTSTATGESITLSHPADNTGITVDIAVMEQGKPLDIFRVYDNAGNLVVTVHADGTMDFGNNFKADSTAIEFWQALASGYPRVCDANAKSWQRVF